MFVPLSFSLSGLSIPVVGSEHIVPEHYRSRPLQFLSLIVASPLLTKVSVLSEAIRIRYPSGLSKKMIAMPNPVISIDGQVGYDNIKTRYTLLNIGRLDEQKDHATLLQAFAKIAAVLPNWDLKIIGEGPLRNKLEAMIDDYGLKDRVAMPGITSNIETEYCNADAFVISSRYESFGLVTAESMSYGLPVIGFADCPGTNTLIESGKTGLLVAAGEDRIESLAVELQYLLSNQNFRKQLGQAGKQAIEGRFSIQHITDLWEKLLGSVCLKT
jgi:glycosyltransferase involved in cell wall biosynthesis